MFSWNIWACLHVSMAICFPWIHSRENTGMHIHLIASQSVVKVMGMYNFHVNIFTNEPHLSLIFCYNSSQKCCLLINDPWRKSHSNHHHRVISSALWSGWSEGGNRRVQAVSHRCENAMQQYGKLAYVLSAWQLCTPGPVWITRGAWFQILPCYSCLRGTLQGQILVIYIQVPPGPQMPLSMTNL